MKQLFAKLEKRSYQDWSMIVPTVIFFGSQQNENSAGGTKV